MFITLNLIVTASPYNMMTVTKFMAAERASSTFTVAILLKSRRRPHPSSNYSTENTCLLHRGRPVPIPYSDGVDGVCGFLIAVVDTGVSFGIFRGISFAEDLQDGLDPVSQGLLWFHRLSGPIGPVGPLFP